MNTGYTDKKNQIFVEIKRNFDKARIMDYLDNVHNEYKRQPIVRP